MEYLRGFIATCFIALAGTGGAVIVVYTTGSPRRLTAGIVAVAVGLIGGGLALGRTKKGVGSAANAKDQTSKTPREIRQFFLTIVGTLAVVLAIDLITEMPAYIDYKSGLPQKKRDEFEPTPIVPSWVISGSPVFHTAAFQHSPHWDAWSGIWECIGPAKFVWHYSVDEVIYVLEGSAEIEYLGSKFILNAGDSIRFVSGTIATWVVTDRVKKTFSDQKPGLLVKVMRGIVGYFG